MRHIKQTHRPELPWNEQFTRLHTLLDTRIKYEASEPAFGQSIGGFSEGSLEDTILKMVCFHSVVQQGRAEVSLFMSPFQRVEIRGGLIKVRPSFLLPLILPWQSCFYSLACNMFDTLWSRVDFMSWQVEDNFPHSIDSKALFILHRSAPALHSPPPHTYTHAHTSLNSDQSMMTVYEDSCPVHLIQLNRQLYISKLQ